MNTSPQGRGARSGRRRGAGVEQRGGGLRLAARLLESLAFLATRRLPGPVLPAAGPRPGLVLLAARRMARLVLRPEEGLQAGLVPRLQLTSRLLAGLVLPAARRPPGLVLWVAPLV